MPVRVKSALVPMVADDRRHFRLAVSYDKLASRADQLSECNILCTTVKPSCFNRICAFKMLVDVATTL